MKQEHPDNIGIVGLSIYFPKRSVKQEDLGMLRYTVSGRMSHQNGLGFDGGLDLGGEAVLNGFLVLMDVVMWFSIF